MVGRNMGKAELEHVVPAGEGPLSEAITLRMPKRLKDRIERCAKETDNNRSDAVLHLLRWALEQYESKGKK